MDKQINEKLSSRPPSRTETHKKDTSIHSPAKHSNQQRYVVIFIVICYDIKDLNYIKRISSKNYDKSMLQSKLIELKKACSL